MTGRLRVAVVLLSLGAAHSAAAQDGGNVTLVQAPGMTALAESQRTITHWLGQALAEFTVAPQGLRGDRGLPPARDSVETAWTRSRTLEENFAAFAAAEGLGIPATVFCARVAGASVGPDERVAVALARHHVEAMIQALALSGLEEAHAAVRSLLESLDAAPARRRGRAKAREETRESVAFVEQRLAKAIDLFGREVLAPLAAAISEVPGKVTAPDFAARVCSAPQEASPTFPSSSPPPGETTIADDFEQRTEGTHEALKEAINAVRAALEPPLDLDVPRYIAGGIVPPRKLREVKPTYTERARAACVGGRVVLQSVIAKDGSVRDITVLRHLPGLTVAAVSALRRSTFQPATVNGKPVDVYYNSTITFTPPARCVRVTSPALDPWP